jgi:hypothetical protein
LIPSSVAPSRWRILMERSCRDAGSCTSLRCLRPRGDPASRSRRRTGPSAHSAPRAPEAFVGRMPAASTSAVTWAASRARSRERDASVRAAARRGSSRNPA